MRSRLRATEGTASTDASTDDMNNDIRGHTEAKLLLMLLVAMCASVLHYREVFISSTSE